MRLVRLILGVIFLTVLIVGVIAVAPTLRAATSPALIGWAMVGLALAVASVFHLIFLLIEQSLISGEGNTYDPLKVAQDFSNRIAGVSQLPELAAATGAILESRLKIQRAGWLLLTPREANFHITLLAGKNPFPADAVEFSRNNPLLRQLDLQRQPIVQPDFESDPKYTAMAAQELEWLKAFPGEVYVPVFDAGLLAAVLVAGERAKRAPFRPAEVELLQLIAGLSATALKAARVIADLKKLNASMSSLNESLQNANETMHNMSLARSDFLAIASHELRTPITQMLGFADLLGSMAQDDHLDRPTIAEITDSLVRGCNRLNEVVTQMLDMSQIDVEAMDLKFEDTTLDEVMRLSIEPYLSTLKERRLALKVAGLKMLPPIRVDKHRLAQAFNQLMSNAIKYTPDGGRLEVTARLLPPQVDQPPQLEIVFADGGIGIDVKHHQLIFQKFYRVGSAAVHSTGATKFMGAGPGLGLPIAKGVIEGHGGRLWVESPGHDPARLPGSRFYVILPIKPPAFDPKALTGSEAARKSAKKEMTIVPSKSPFIGMD